MSVQNEIGNDHFSNIKQDIIEELNFNSWSYTYSGLDKVLDVWSQRKTNLYNILSKHPKFVKDCLMIQFDCATERKLDVYAINHFYDIFCRQFNLRYIPNSYITAPFYHEIMLMKGPYLTSQNAKFFNKYFECTYFRKGQKTSRAVNKIYELLGAGKDAWFNREFAKFSDAITPKETTRHMCLSIHPMDFLLMSNGNSWSSCHSIIAESGEEPGCHCSGTISYMLDETSMIFYEVEEFDESPQTLPKIIRQVICFNGEMLVTNRLYPQNMDSGANSIYTKLNEVIRNVLSECYPTTINWIKEDTPYRNEREDLVFHEGTAYPDWLYTPQTEIWRTTLKKCKSIKIGAYPICVECGREHDLASSITCCSSPPNSERWYCECCGEYFNEDDISWSDYENEYLCYDCRVWCKMIDDYIRESTEVYTDIAGDFVPQSLINNGEYSICEKCGCLIYCDDIIETEDGHKFCPDCGENDGIVYECDYCGEYYRTIDMHSIDEETVYCEECYKHYCNMINEQETA